ncbi:MAG: hypothetical protein AAGB34_05640, partial [Planctomycetota bacterium]
AWRMVDLANYRQIGIGVGSYQADHDKLPLFPAIRNLNGGPIDRDPSNAVSTANWMNGWALGGKSTRDFIETYQTFYSHESERPLNPYLYPNIQFEDWDGINKVEPDDRPEREFFRSPADGPNSEFARQAANHEEFARRGVSKFPVGFDNAESMYDLVGTSYFQNSWLIFSYRYNFYAPEFDPRINGNTYRYTMELFVEAIVRDMERTLNPSRFVYAYEPILELTQDATLSRGVANPTLLKGRYGEVGVHQMLMLDGSAGPQTITQNDVRFPHLKGYYPHISLPPINNAFAIGSDARYDSELREAMQTVLDR